MNHRQLDELLRRYDRIERIQAETRTNIGDFDGGEWPPDSDGVPRMKGAYFFGGGPVFINKHHRFADMPVHKHEFIELNYMYAGSCTQEINGRSVTLGPGDIILLDRDVAHGIAALGDRDILVNILLKREALSPSFLNRLGKGGIVQGFLSRVLLEHQRHDRYLVFRCGDQDRLQQLVRNLLCEFFGGDDYTGDALNHYVPLLLIELMRVYRLDAHEDSGLADEGADLLEILGYIEKHFRRCTLGELARRFHFNPNYLGNLLKDRTGFTFTELVQKQRLNRAALLLRTTERSIGEIAADCGYESPGYFHRLFKSRYGTTPSRYRRNPPNAKSRNDL